MKVFYSMTELMTNDMETVTLTNVHSKEKDEIFNMFHTRKAMLLKTHGVTIIRDEFSEKDEWGFIKVLMENGITIELAMGSVQLV